MKKTKLFFAIVILLTTNLTQAQQTLNESFLHNGVQRDYTIHIPTNYVQGNAVPLLFCFHGYTSNAGNIMFYSNFNAISDTANFIVVYPQGTLLSGSTHWNVGGWTTGSTADDIGFTEAMIDSISADYSIDPKRVYSTGMSNGGYMSFLLACQLSSKIAAVASITGSMTPQMYNACNPQHPTPVLQVHGDADGTVPYNGDPTWTKSITDVIAYWVDYNNCDTSASINSLPNINTGDGSTVDQFVNTNGDNCSSVEHFKVYGGDHDWPGAWGNMDMNASIEIWRFLSRYHINGLIGCSTTSTIENEGSQINSKVYPNPFGDQLTIETNFTNAREFNIYSVHGELLLTGQLTANVSTIDLSSLAPNVYILKAENLTIRLIKTK